VTIDFVLLWIITNTMTSPDSRKNLPFVVPRQVTEWKRLPDNIWCDKTHLTCYWDQMKPEINVAHCHEFIESMRQQDKNEDYPAGVVEGILVNYSAPW